MIPGQLDDQLSLVLSGPWSAPWLSNIETPETKGRGQILNGHLVIRTEVSHCPGNPQQT